jgi:trk system potassium uptake protein TrkH
VFTLSIEFIGALILWICFWHAETPHPLWAAIFHSVAAFCTAGISVFPDNLESFADNSAICMTIAMLSLLGGIGFIVMDDLYRSIKSKSLRTTLTTRIILVATFGAIFVGTVFLFFDPHLAEFSLQKRILTAFFQTVSALTTAGFKTVPIGSLAGATAVIIIILMTLGASPSGTGGGLKTTTWSAAIAAILTFFRGQEEITFFRSKVPHGRTTAAFASIALYMITFAMGVYCLLLFDTQPFEYVVFEVASALGTGGLSYGITPDLSIAGKIVIMILMYIGRLGVVSLALGAVALYRDILHEPEESDKPKPPIKEDDIVL